MNSFKYPMSQPVSMPYEKSSKLPKNLGPKPVQIIEMGAFKL